METRVQAYNTEQKHLNERVVLEVLENLKLLIEEAEQAMRSGNYQEAPLQGFETNISRYHTALIALRIRSE